MSVGVQCRQARLAQRGYPMSGIIHRIVMAVLLVAALLLFWNLLGH